MDTPRIYVACLASYNNGILHGEWIDATQDPEDIKDAITAMLASSPTPGAEEYAIHDYDGFGDLARTLGEYPDIDKVCELAQMIEEHGEAYIAYAGNVGTDYATPDGFRDAFAGQYSSEEDWAYDYAESTGLLENIPETLRSYFDYERYARDARLSGDMSFVTVDGTLYVFHNF